MFLVFGTDLILLAVWTWCIYAIRFPNVNEDAHRIWGTEFKCYRADVDDGSFYGTLLVPIIAVAKLIDTQNTMGNSSYVEYIQAYTELCILMSCGIILHMFLSKHFTIRRLATIWATLIVSGLSISTYVIMTGLGWLPYLKSFPWHFIILSQSFYQVSLYSIVNIFRKSFTFGELAIVAQSITLMAAETWIITVNEFNLIDLPSFTKHSFSPLIIFHNALILGMLLIGILLSPVLLRSRHLAQQPTWKNKDPSAVEVEKKWMAFMFYGGTAVIILGVVGQLVHVIINENPYLWTIDFVISSPTRIFLCIYWSSAVVASIVLYNHISHMRKNLSLNSKRKYYHALAVMMFIPGYLLDMEFMHLAFSVALSSLIFLEYLRYFAVYPFGKQLHVFLSEFLDHRDSGPAILSHLYLLIGCAGGVWLNGSSILANVSGILTLGLGDAMASIVGRRYGHFRWPGTSKTFEGTVSFIIFELIGAAITILCAGANASLNISQWLAYTFVVILTALLEAFSHQNDNLVIPLYLWPLVFFVL